MDSTPDAYHTIFANELLGMGELVVDNAAICSALKPTLDARNVEELQQGLALDRKLSCQSTVDAREISNRILGDLDARKTNIRWLRPAMAVLNELSKRGDALPSKVRESFSKAVASLSGLLEPNGMVQNSANNAGLLYHILADANEMSLDSATSAIEKAIESVPTLFERLAADSPDFTIVPPGDSRDGELKNLIAASNVLSGTSRLLHLGSPTRSIDLEVMTGLVGYLLGEKNIATPKAVYYLGAAVHALKDDTLPEPLLVFAKPEKKQGDRLATLFVSGIMGRTEEDYVVHVASLARDGKPVPNFQAFAAPSISSDRFQLQLPNLALRSGRHEVTVEVRAKSPARKAARTATLGVCVFGELKISGLGARILPLEGEAEAGPIQFEPLGSPLSLELEKGQGLVLTATLLDSASGDPYPAKQVLVSLTEKVSGRISHIVWEKKDKGVYTFKFPRSLLAGQKQEDGALYAATLIVGDPCLQDSISWNFATIAVGKVQLEASTTERGKGYTPRPDIIHIERPAEKRPSVYVSTAFVGLALTPSILLFYILSKMGLEFKGLPKGTRKTLLAVAFHLGVLAILFLYVAFWLILNLKETLPILLVLLIWTTFFGRLYLKGKKTNKEKEA